MESHADGKPFFMLSQNPLADATYLHYLRTMFGGKIHTLTDEDSQKGFQDYTLDAQRRLAHDQQFPNEPRQLKSGEDVRLDSNGRIQLSGQMNVIGIREMLTKIISTKIPTASFTWRKVFRRGDHSALRGPAPESARVRAVRRRFCRVLNPSQICRQQTGRAAKENDQRREQHQRQHRDHRRLDGGRVFRRVLHVSLF